MTAIGKLNDFGICNPPRNTMYLLKRTIFIVKSLHRKHRTTDILDFRFNRSFPKQRMQADIVQPQNAKSGSAWLPSASDREYVANLMGRVAEVGKFASWIAHPPIGINRQAVNFEYIRFN